MISEVRLGYDGLRGKAELPTMVSEVKLSYLQ